MTALQKYHLSSLFLHSYILLFSLSSISFSSQDDNIIARQLWSSSLKFKFPSFITSSSLISFLSYPNNIYIILLLFITTIVMNLSHLLQCKISQSLLLPHWDILLFYHLHFHVFLDTFSLSIITFTTSFLPLPNFSSSLLLFSPSYLISPYHLHYFLSLRPI